uniref:Z/E14+E13 fatty acid desaturase n=1 Tax=Manduca sexta TaxID=7130 RepID=A0A0K2GUR4_MANSE|nr:Z/E14+E13 fatty acid desaturase [Manduca sexta]
MPTQMETAETDDSIDTTLTKATPWKPRIKYYYVFFQLYFHVAAIYGVYLALTSAKWQTNLFGYVMIWINSLGIYAGAHRLFSHRSYKATRALQIFLMLCHSTAYQRNLFLWVLEHRLHHKYSDTDGDPHNPSRGLFFSHIGWLCCKKHPEVVKRTKNIDMSDMYSNPVIMFQKKHQQWLLPTLAFILPTLIPMVFWVESFTNSWHINAARYIMSMNTVFLINSVSHKWGYRPYDKNIRPTESKMISMITFGEGFHNYHHIFPNDYRDAEFGNNLLNVTTYFIDFCSFLGPAYDLKTVPTDLVKSRMTRTGNGSEMELLDKTVYEIL